VNHVCVRPGGEWASMDVCVHASVSVKHVCVRPSEGCDQGNVFCG